MIGGIRTFVRRLADLTHAYRILPNMVELADGSVWVKVTDGNGPPLARCRITEPNEFLEDEFSRTVRSDTALEMMDPDVHGYLLFLLRREEDGQAHLALRAQTLAHWLPTFIAGFSRVLENIHEVPGAA